MCRRREGSILQNNLVQLTLSCVVWKAPQSRSATKLHKIKR